MMPSPRTFLTAEWRDLAMLNYAVDPGVLAPLIPAGTELDFFEGQTFASVIGFRFLRTRVFGVAVPLHTDFDEVNLRFYVRRRGAEGWRRGVVFVRELVPRRAIAFLARAVYGEPYRRLPMRHQIDRSDEGIRVEYGWKRAGRWESLHATGHGQPQEIAAGSREEFITEHYWGYTTRRPGSSSEYQVEHPRWRIWHDVKAGLDADAAALYGERFASCLAAGPAFAFIAEGSAVAVRKNLAV
jgi:uncharacterized protein YqjF (DUF2071 family)